MVMWGGWSHCKEMNVQLFSAFYLVWAVSIWDIATHVEVFSLQLNLLVNIYFKYPLRFVSQVLLNPVVVTLRTNYHTCCLTCYWLESGSLLSLFLFFTCSYFFFFLPFNDKELLLKLGHCIFSRSIILSCYKSLKTWVPCTNSSFWCLWAVCELLAKDFFNYFSNIVHGFEILRNFIFRCSYCLYLLANLEKSNIANIEKHRKLYNKTMSHSLAIHFHSLFLLTDVILFSILLLEIAGQRSTHPGLFG